MRIDDLLEANPVLALRQYPRQVRTIQRAAERGLVAPVLPGVYLRPVLLADPAARLLAASLWSCQGSVVGATAVELLLGRAITMPIHLRTPTRARPASWIEPVRGRVPAVHRRYYRGISTVTAEYACLEVAASDQGEALFEALRRRLVTRAGLEATLPAFARSPGNPVRREVAARAMSNPWSFAEALLHALLEVAGITGWVANQPVRLDGELLFPDAWFPAERVILEFDGEAVHSTHEQFERDRSRQNLFVAHGYRVVRVTWEMLTEHPYVVIDTLRAVLALT